MTMNALQTKLLISRRTTLTAGTGLTALFALSLTGCGGADTNGEDGAPAAPEADRPKESPMLTEQVEAGDLPEFDERLPEPDHRLVLDTQEYGVYGGTFQGAVLGEGDEAWLARLVDFEPMMRPSLDLTETGHPGALLDIDVSDDGDEYTLHLRHGMRWSDGEPATADDVMFAIEHVYFNTDLYSTPPEILAVDGDPCTAERIDDYTVTLTFPGAKGDFIDLASRESGGGGNLLNFAKHYFEQFLPELNSEAGELAEEEGFSDWLGHWEAKNEWHNNPERPVLNAWILMSPLNQGGVVTFERNPYYWKVDDDGAQLPFIDRLDFEVIGDEEVMLLRAINGEIDFHDRYFTNDQNRPVLADSREEGDYRFVTAQPTSMNRDVIALNFNHNDDVLAEVFQNKDFRIGLSHAIDRQEIIDTVYQRQGEPWQVAPRPDSEYYDEEFAKQYTEYDVDLANQYLDDAGYDQTDSDGFRLGPDGDRITFSLDVASDHTQRIASMDFVTNYWREVGIDARVNTMERTLFYDRKTASASQHDGNVWGGDGGLRVEMMDTRWWFPSTAESNFATRWAEWFSSRGSSSDAEEPPEEPRRQMELFWQIRTEPDPDEQARMFQEIIQIAKEQFYVIGIALPAEGYGIVSNNLHNVAETYIDGAQYMSPGYTNTSPWFFRD